jgi:hypothetical protein
VPCIEKPLALQDVNTPPPQSEDDSDFERRQRRKRKRRRDRHRRHQRERADSVDKSDSSLERAVHAYRRKLHARRREGRRLSDGLPLSSTDDEAESWGEWRRRMKKLYRFCRTEVESEESSGEGWGGGERRGVGITSVERREAGEMVGGKGIGSDYETRRGGDRREAGTRGEGGAKERGDSWRGGVEKDPGVRGGRVQIRTGGAGDHKKVESAAEPNCGRGFSMEDGRLEWGQGREREGRSRGARQRGGADWGGRSCDDTPAPRLDRRERGSSFGKSASPPRCDRAGRSAGADVSRGDVSNERLGTAGEAGTDVGQRPRRGGLKRSWGEQDGGGGQGGRTPDASGKKQARVRWADEERVRRESVFTPDVLKQDGVRWAGEGGVRRESVRTPDASNRTGNGVRWEREEGSVSNDSMFTPDVTQQDSVRWEGEGGAGLADRTGGENVISVNEMEGRWEDRESDGDSPLGGSRRRVVMSLSELAGDAGGQNEGQAMEGEREAGNHEGAVTQKVRGRWMLLLTLLRICV